MPRLLPAIFLVLAALPAIAGDGNAWLTTYGAAREASERSNKNLLLVFGAEDCIWCKKLEDGPLKQAKAAGLLEGLVLAWVDAEDTPDVVAYLEIDAFPTLVLAKPDGTVLRTARGYLAAGPLFVWLRGPRR